MLFILNLFKECLNNVKRTKKWLYNLRRIGLYDNVSGRIQIILRKEVKGVVIDNIFNEIQDPIEANLNSYEYTSSAFLTQTTKSILQN